MSAIAENTAAPFDKEQLLAAFRSLSAEEMADILEEMQRGMDLWRARQPDAEVPIAKSSKPASAPDRRAKERKPKAAAAPPAAPEAEDGEAPSAASYRVSSVKEGVCAARRISEGTKDARWKPAIYAEEQCGRALEAGSDLCPICKNHLQKYTDNPSPKAGWHGRVSEEPLDWMHMLGTAWAAKATPRFGAVSEVASVASAPAAAAPKPGRKPKQTEEEKEAAKAAKAAEKEAAKAAKAAEKEAVKAAAAAAVEKVRADAAAKKAAAAPAAAKADTATPAATVAHKVVCVAGEMYAVRGRNAFEYNPLDDSVGEYAGRLSEDGNSVDAEAPQEE